MNNNPTPANSSSAPLGKSQPSDIVKKRQYFLLGALLLAILGISFIGVMMGGGSSSSSKKNAQKVETKTITAPGQQIDAKDAWMSITGAQVKTLENENKEMKDRLRAMEEQMKALIKDQSTARSPVKLPPDQVLPRPGSSSSLKETPTPGTPKFTPPPTAKLTGPGPTPGPGISGSVPFRPQGPVVTGPAQTDPIKTLSLGRRGTGSELAGGPAGTGKTQSVKHYIPSGSFIKATLISGVDAPTSSSGQSDPTPVLLRLTDNAIMPNFYRGRLKDCFIVGAAYGDLSSERVYIRTESLSCIGTNGKVVDVGLKGWVSGSDGKAGVRGILVSKQGAALANALLAGVISGFGSAIQLQSTTTSTSALGSTSSIDSGADAFKSGLGAGIGKAADRLAKYYIDLADKMHPIISISASEKMEVVLTKGVSLADLFENTGEGSNDYPAIAARNRAINSRAD